MKKFRPLGRILAFASTATVALAAGTVHAQEDAAAASASADAAQGIITGRVYDDVTGKSLQGAIIQVSGTNTRDATREDGSFQISVPAGSVTLRVSYVGLDAVTQIVDVPRHGNVVANIGLTSRTIGANDIVVRAVATGQARATNQQKTANGVVNIVSEEMFGSTPDGNLGYVLQRLPGLTVDTEQDGSPSGINIRGIEGDYNSFQIDGNRVPASGGGRGIAMTQFSSDAITSVEVIKAPTPDRDGDAIGGIVNVITRSAFQRKGREIKLDVGGIYSDLPNKFGHAVAGQFSDILSIGGGDRNFGISGGISSYRTNRFSNNRDMDWIRVSPANNPALNLDQYGDPAPRFMEASHWEYDTRVTDTLTGNLNLDFRTNPFNSFYAKFFYSKAKRHGIKYETDIDIDTAYDEDDGNLTYDLLTPDSGRGTSESEASRGWIGTEDRRRSDLYTINFGGRHEGANSLLTYDLFHSRNKDTSASDNELNFLMEPHDPWLMFEYKINNVSRGDVSINELTGQDPTDLSLVTEGEMILRSSIRTEDAYSARADFERKFDLGSGTFTLKTGAKYYLSKLRFDQVGDDYEMDEDFPYEKIVRPNDSVMMGGKKYFDVIPANGVDLLNSNPELFEIDKEGSLETNYSRDYDASEKTAAGYIMGTLTLGAHTILGGVRYEHVKWENENYKVSYLGGSASYNLTEQGDSYGNWLPSIHLRHELTPNLIMRESYNRSYGRPKLEQLTAGRFTNEDGDVSEGNPDLKPALSDNFDAQVEYYTDSGGFYSAAIFYKKIKNFTYDSSCNFTDIDADAMPICVPGGDFEYERPVNGARAKNYGIELTARQRLIFLPGALRGLSINLSATFADSSMRSPTYDEVGREGPVPGFSKFLFTTSVDWAWRGFDIRGDFIHRSSYIEGLEPDPADDEFFASENRVDLSASYNFTNSLQTYVSVTNLTDEPQVSYAGYRPFVEDTSLTGRKVRFGVSYIF